MCLTHGISALNEIFLQIFPWKIYISKKKKIPIKSDDHFSWKIIYFDGMWYRAPSKWNPYMRHKSIRNVPCWITTQPHAQCVYEYKYVQYSRCEVWWIYMRIGKSNSGKNVRRRSSRYREKLPHTHTCISIYVQMTHTIQAYIMVY